MHKSQETSVKNGMAAEKYIQDLKRIIKNKKETLQHLYKRIAICGSNQPVGDNRNDPKEHVVVVLKVLSHAYGCKPHTVPPKIICDLLKDASKWYNKAYKIARKEVDREGEFEYEGDEYYDAIHTTALLSDPPLTRIVESLPCNEEDIDNEPYPMIGEHKFKSSELMIAAKITRQALV